MKYEYLFKEGNIGKLKLKNRVIMPAMGTMLASADGEVTDHQIAYFEERAKGGVGLIITEVTSVEYLLGKAGSCHPRVDDNKFIPMLQRLADTLHKYDTKVFMQLHHAGRVGNSMLTGGKQVVAPSAVPSQITGETPRALTTEEIKDLINRFATGALRCKMAGIDGVELHGAHGYLICQFLSPFTNRRTDEYGGSFENRMRFAEEIVKGIKKTCGENYPVTIRLSIDEFMEGGITEEEGLKIAKYMESIGVDAINASCGNYESLPTVMEPITYEQGWRVYLAEEIKKAVNIPVIAVGVIREPEFAESVLKEGKADFVAIGRSHITDPDWCNKAQEGREKDIRKCISCLHCVDSAFAGHHMECAINTRAGRELEFKNLEKSGDGRKVVVIGGGPGGLEAARILAERNFKVVLFEKDSELGGQIKYGHKPEGKEKLHWLIDYQRNELENLGVEIRLNTEGKLENVKAENPYVVIVATGAMPFMPNIEGIDRENVYTSEDALSGKSTFEGEAVAVIGGGMTGSEIAEFIANQGNAVYLIEMLSEIGTGCGLINKIDLMQHLFVANVEILTNYKLNSIGEKSIKVQSLKEDKEVELDIDKVVISLGVKSDNELYEKIKNNFNKVYLIGDAASPRNIAHAVREGFEKAYILK